MFLSCDDKKSGSLVLFFSIIGSRMCGVYVW